MIPLAPGLFSTIKGCPSSFDIPLASSLAVMSAAPPGEKGTSNVMGLPGNAWARADGRQAIAPMAVNVFRRFIMIVRPSKDVGFTEIFGVIVDAYEATSLAQRGPHCVCSDVGSS